MNKKIKIALCLGVFVLVVLLGCSCGLTPSHDFQLGQCVQMKLDGRKGTVIDNHNYRSHLVIRFSGLQERTNTHPLFSDDEIERTPYAMVMVNAFELKPCNENY